MTTRPVVWVLGSDKLGDNAQLEQIAACLAGCCAVEPRRLVFKARHRVGKPWFTPSVRHVDVAASSPLSPPWPDLILTAGRRPAMVALWIKAQSNNATRVALVGRPKRWPHAFDLIIAASQYLIPAWPNVVTTRLPLMDIDHHRLAQARTQFADALAAVPRPLTAVMIGAATRPFRLRATDIERMLGQLRARSGGQGTLWLVTSRRTSAEVRDALPAMLRGSDRLHDFSNGGANPYLALLADADDVAVTGDSVSMITEAVRAGRPLTILPLPRSQSRFAAWVDRLLDGSRWLRPNAWQRLRLRLGWVAFPRRLEALHETLVRAGLAVWPDTPPRAIERTETAPELAPVIERLCSLLIHHPGATARG